MQGRCTVRSAVIRGVEAVPVDVEVAISQGLPNFCIVGMPDAAVQESRERVKMALRESGFVMPVDRVLVNLAPSSLRKSGSGFDLAIAVGVLIASGQIDPQLARRSLYVGELSLEGRVRCVSGLLAYALCARDLGVDLVCSRNASGLIPVPGLEERGLERLSELRIGDFHPVVTDFEQEQPKELDYGDVSGNELAKRAFQIAATGRHGLLMMGPPGSGKTMLASRMPSILPPLEENEKLHAALIHSVAGERVGSILAGQRPFRAPHHSATAAGLIGGGSPVRPGEISLAHLGTLFLDELPEFKMSVLQQIRQPIEQGVVHIARADGTVSFPADFLLVAAANPCPCGYFGDPDRECSCTVKQIRDYQNRIGGPLLDRIDIHIDVRRVPANEVISLDGGITSEQLREGVLAGREYASWRSSEQKVTTTRELIAACKMADEDSRFFEDMAAMNHMSGRSIVRTLSVARTIADIDQRAQVVRADLCEALGFRLRDGVG